MGQVDSDSSGPCGYRRRGCGDPSYTAPTRPVGSIPPLTDSYTSESALCPEVM
jgi:hypothetical protein